MTEAHQSVRFIFDSIESAAEGLLLVLQDARTTQATYRFGGLSAGQVLHSGLVIEGQIIDVAQKVEQVAGAVRHDH